MIRLGWGVVAAVLAALPAGAAPDGWRITGSLGFDPQILAAEDAYRTVNFGGLGGGGTGEAQPFRLDHALLLELRATRQVDLPAGLTAELSGAASLRHARGHFPNGAGILVDRLDVLSTGHGIDLRAGLRADVGSGWVSSGAGYSWTRSKDQFEYGILTLYEMRVTTLPYGFVKTGVPLFGSGASAYVEAQTSRLGVSLGFGVERDF